MIEFSLRFYKEQADERSAVSQWQRSTVFIPRVCSRTTLAEMEWHRRRNQTLLSINNVRYRRTHYDGEFFFSQGELLVNRTSAGYQCGHRLCT